MEPNKSPILYCCKPHLLMVAPVSMACTPLLLLGRRLDRRQCSWGRCLQWGALRVDLQSWRRRLRMMIGCTCTPSCEGQEHI